MSPLISTTDLAARLGAPDLRIVDGSWHLDGRDARADFEQTHILGAVFFDLDAISYRDSPLPHMMPTPEAFGASVGALGLSVDDQIDRAVSRRRAPVIVLLRNHSWDVKDSQQYSHGIFPQTGGRDSEW